MYVQLHTLAFFTLSN